MANELLISYPTGATLYVLLYDATGNVWNGSAFAAPGSVNWLDYDIAMSEAATATGIYRASMPAAAAGVYGWTVRKQAGVNPAVGDVAVGAGRIEWSGTAEVTLTSRATQTSVDDVPTNTELATALGTADDATLAAIAALAVGNAGIYSYSSTVDDGANPLDGVFVQCATNANFANIIGTTYSNASGAYTVRSDQAGTHYLRFQLAGWNFADETVTLA